MMAAWIPTWVPATVPFLGAAAGLLIWSRPRGLKTWSAAVALGSLLPLMGMADRLSASAEWPLLILLPVVAWASLQGQPLHSGHRGPWLLTLVLLGLGYGVLTDPDRTGMFWLLILLGLLTVLMLRYQAAADPSVWRWGIGMCGLGTVSLGVALIAPEPIAGFALLVPCLTLVPMVPFHKGYVAALTGAPGNLPVFLAWLLPSLGFHLLLSVVPALPAAAVHMLIWAALLGALYGSIKALAQSHVPALVAYSSLAFWSILWWYLLTARAVPAQAGLYLGAVGTATAGLLLAWHVVQGRYGNADVKALGGLGGRMPRYAAVLSLLALAAMGLPPFGVFTGFMSMLLAPPLVVSGEVVLLLVVWLSASWYVLDVVQRLLYGPPRPDLHYEDLQCGELVPLAALVVILLVLGVAPSSLFPAETAPPPAGTLTEAAAWPK